MEFVVLCSRCIEYFCAFMSACVEWVGDFNWKAFMGGKMLFSDAAVTLKRTVMKLLSDQKCTFAGPLIRLASTDKLSENPSDVCCWMIHSNSHLQDLITAIYGLRLIMWGLEIAAAQMPKASAGLSHLLYALSSAENDRIRENDWRMLSSFSFHAIKNVDFLHIVRRQTSRGRGCECCHYRAHSGI